jgi:SAM-dependent methyltransferase
MIDVVLVPLIVIGLVLNGLRLRVRVPPALAPGPGPPDDANFTWIISQGTSLDDETRQAALAYARGGNLDLVDVVPADLPVTAARDLVRAVDARAMRSGRLAPGGSAGAAVLADAALLKRAELTEPPEPAPADVIALARQLRPAASRGAAIVTAPRLRAADSDLAQRRSRLAASGNIPSLHLALEMVPYVLTVIALTQWWQLGLVAAVVYCLQPYLIFAGTPMRPRGLHAAAALRAVLDPLVWVRTAAGRWKSAAQKEYDAKVAEAADYYPKVLAAGTGQFFEDHRADCPWCGSAALAVRIRTPDIVMHKPGTFTLERCEDCGHVFQNPRLTPEGLSFYYRDAYDGLGAGAAETLLNRDSKPSRARARMPEPFITPKSWLDVGTGYGRFCATAREVWPDTVFDGLDQGAGIEEAERRGWVSTGYRGMFPDLAAGLAGRYDVISMHHYLEHTRDPLRELDAAARALPEGGCLLIELPDPQWRLARFFGRYWMPWFQPQHQHLMPIGNLTKALAERGLRTVATERGHAYIPCDAMAAVLLIALRIAPLAWPWSPPRPRAQRAVRGLIWVVAVPAAVVARVLDRTLIAVLARHWDYGNAYRVLARKEDLGYGG